MSHIRTLARTAVIDRLRAAVPSLGGRAEAGSRILRALQSHDIPTALVNVSETAPTEITAVRPRRIRRNLSVAIELLAAADGDHAVEDELDAMAVEVEAALAEPSFLPMTAHEWRLSGSTPGYGDAADAVLGTLTLTYALSVVSTEGRPDTHR